MFYVEVFVAAVLVIFDVVLAVWFVRKMVEEKQAQKNHDKAWNFYSESARKMRNNETEEVPVPENVSHYALREILSCNRNYKLAFSNGWVLKKTV